MYYNYQLRKRGKGELTNFSILRIDFPTHMSELCALKKEDNKGNDGRRTPIKRYDGKTYFKENFSIIKCERGNSPIAL